MRVVNVTIVGVGPRGISVLERIGAAAPSQQVHLHLVDVSEVGAGAVWLTDQTRALCMNTLAGAVTLFTEPGSTLGIPVQQGPTMFEWIQRIRGDLDAPLYSLYETYPADASAPVFSEDLRHLIASFEDEISVTRTESNPSRALYGAYLKWCFEIALDRLPDTVQVYSHRDQAVSLTEVTEAGRTFDRIQLAGGGSIDSDVTVLALGWITPAESSHEEELALSGLPWVKPANPLLQAGIRQLPAASSGQKVLVRGLGMGFFDLMALVTLDRGGRFLPDEQAPGGLRYEASGAEPHLVVASGRGYPFLPKSEYGDLPPVAPTPAFDEVYQRLVARDDSISFRDQVYPAILSDVLAQDPSFQIEEWVNPLGDFVGSLDQLTSHVATRLEQDIHHAELAASSPLKNALWVISSVRKRIMILGSGGRYEDQAEVSRFMKMGQMVGSGPPAFRSRQLLALIHAGLISFAGARPSITAEKGEWVMRTATSQEAVTGAVLVDAWMHKPDAFHTSDSLLLSLKERMRPFRGSGSPETDPATRLLVHEDGGLDPRVLLIGIPTGTQHPDTTISPMPGTDPLFLQETDKAARTVLERIRQMN
ncbi:FAD/NAD(P)-binding protein [Rothia nasimurium]|uniref:FAD/NAD(P)-binding protein n=1 Tax=Rothia nasimurium TaxID=85336 RepID=UPI003BA2E4B5